MSRFSDGFWRLAGSKRTLLKIDWLTKLILFFIVAIDLWKGTPPSFLLLVVIGLMLFSSTLSLIKPGIEEEEEYEEEEEDGEEEEEDEDEVEK